MTIQMAKGADKHRASRITVDGTAFPIGMKVYGGNLRLDSWSRHGFGFPNER